ncbi:MAG: HEAT repeat domain-containing protein [Chloroflexota bacterium]
MFENIRIDQISFWVGFAIASVFWALFGQVRPLFKIVRQMISDQFSSVQKGLSTTIEHRYRQDLVKIVQERHLSSPLFSLEEIALEPRLLAPPPTITPGGVIPTEDLTDIAVPYLPDVNAVGGKFFVRTITIPQAMSQGENLLLLGQPGSGKSFTLNLLTSWIASRNPKAGHLAELIPISVHVAELNLPAKKDRLAEVLYKALSDQVSMLVENRLQDFFKAALEKKLCLVMVDGLDELPATEQKPVVEFLSELQKAYPGNRYIISAAFENISAMEALDLFPIGMAGWTPNQKKAFVHRWSKLWAKHVVPQNWSNALPEVYDPIILNRWILEDSGFDSPFYLTMRTWAGYSGDSRGTGKVNAIESYLMRMTGGQHNERAALEQLAAQITISQTPILTRRVAGSYVSAFEDEDISEEEEITLEPTITEAAEPDSEAMFLDDDFDAMLDELDELDVKPTPAPVIKEEKSSSEDVSKREVRRMLPVLVDARILAFQPSSKVNFIHPIFCGYLAAANLANQPHHNPLGSQRDWIGKSLAEVFLAAQPTDLTRLITERAQASQREPLRHSLVASSSWLRYAPKTANWRPTLMRTLATSLQNSSLSLGVRARLLAGLAESDEPGIGKLFQQMLTSPEHSVRWLGALGCGIIKDQGVVGELGTQLYDPSIFVSRAACLALVTIGTTKALELITTALLEANEEVRRAAAEALSLHPDEGYPILKEGITLDDVLVRRAVVFGLARVKQKWAVDILQQVVVEDEEWLVRNAALQIMEESKTKGPIIPKPIPPIHELPWLISFASDKGMGVSPGQAGWDILAKVLKEGNEEQRLAALQIYRRKPGEAISVIKTLLEIHDGPEGEIRESAYNTLWHLKSFGLNLKV